nr:MAG: structural protein [Bee densovirus 5]
MSKRRRNSESDLTSSEDAPASTTSGGTADIQDMETGSAGGEGGGTSGNGGARGGNHIFHPHKPMKLENHQTHTFTKHFYVKIYANDWHRFIPGNEPGTTSLVGFMTVIPYQALCMYISPQEYLEIVRNNSYCKIEDSNFQLEFKAVRTPFDTNSSDQAEANGNLQFEIQRWDGLEKVLPFDTIDIQGVTVPGETPTYTEPKSYIELINRLYGLSFNDTNTLDYNFPATMRERGLSYRPRWKFNATPGNTSVGPLYRPINRYISSIPIGEYVTDSLNTNQAKMGEGYCFNKSYKPKNGILAMASSAYDPQNFIRPGATQINIKNRMVDELATNAVSIPDCQYITVWNQSNTDVVGPNDQFKTVGVTCGSFLTNDNQKIQLRVPAIGDNTGTCPTTEDVKLRYELTAPLLSQYIDSNGTKALTNVNDCVGFGFENSLSYYTTANLENYQSFTSNNERPLHHMPSMMIGAIPKTNKNNTIVNATLEFEIRTSITIKCSSVHPTYMNMAIDTLGEAGAELTFVDPMFRNALNPFENVYGGKWFHNEKDVLLREPKLWHLNYGRAAKPKFTGLPSNVPTL